MRRKLRWIMKNQKKTERTLKAEETVKTNEKKEIVKEVRVKQVKKSGKIETITEKGSSKRERAYENEEAEQQKREGAGD